LSIGDFSRMTQLSVKTLRHYHDVGLVVPSHVDPETGYRYYTLAQLPTAQVVRRLRGLDMPIADVRAVLAAEPDARNELISGHLARLEAELAATRDAVESLRAILDRPSSAPHIEHRTVPATPAIGVQHTVDRADLPLWFYGAIGELRATVAAQGLSQTGPPGGLYDGDIFEHDRGQATVFIPAGGAARPIGRVEPFTVPPAELAVLCHHGSHADVDLTYSELGSYATRHEISVDGPLREDYVCFSWNTPDETRWETNLGWPIFRSDRS
jgi:DNA-binding transcriptional MerR regulator